MTAHTYDVQTVSSPVALLADIRILVRLISHLPCSSFGMFNCTLHLASLPFPTSLPPSPCYETSLFALVFSCRLQRTNKNGSTVKHANLSSCLLLYKSLSIL